MKRLVLLLLNLLMPMILFAASNDLCFRHFSVEDGLSSNSVRALIQDKYGFLWIGTDEGLNRYDGTTVKLYRLKDRGANEAISSLYSTLNKIWIGTDEGIYIYDYETEDIMPLYWPPPKISILKQIRTILSKIKTKTYGSLR